ncbi:thermonuclease family protein [Alicyclobacillus dauci]|uniref:Thermonuclease family protein n=1 Tax=Alicyclobacillus dauci TaxID=1475485 RepID=A0ABY6Z426_9BACL|nr:thermonuclease family protein [Alicyclobacillus dauci]WAH37606.1 thermonuclease family protein [Alicyclobacillus dauci]
MIKKKLAAAALAILPIITLAGCADTNNTTAATNQAVTLNAAETNPVSNGAATTTHQAKASTEATPNLIPVVVSKETDGDTIHVKMPNGQDKTIRMLLIDTPEDVKPNTPVEPFSLQAASFAKQELPVGKQIYIEEGKPGYTTDKYGRLLAFVYVTKTDMYNEDVVKKGLARVGYIYPPNTQHLAQLEADQSYAKSHHLGIWTIPGYVTADGYNMSAVHYSSTASKKTSSSTSTTKTTTSTTTTAARQSTGLRLVSFTQDVTPGEYATIAVHGVPGTTADIEVDYKSGPSHAAGLVPETVGSNGDVSWEWKVGTRTTPGDWPVTVTDNGHTLTETLHVS